MFLRNLILATTLFASTIPAIAATAGDPKEGHSRSKDRAQAP